MTELENKTQTHTNTANETIHLMKEGICSRRGPAALPPKSCDLTSLDYFWRGYVKSLVYVDMLETVEDLRDNIRCIVADIRPQLPVKN